MNTFDEELIARNVFEPGEFVTSSWCADALAESGRPDRHLYAERRDPGWGSGWMVAIGGTSLYHSISRLVVGGRTRRDVDTLYNAATWLLTPAAERARRPKRVQDAGILPLHIAGLFGDVEMHCLLVGDTALIRVDRAPDGMLPWLIDHGLREPNACANADGSTTILGILVGI